MGVLKIEYSMRWEVPLQMHAYQLSSLKLVSHFCRNYIAGWIDAGFLDCLTRFAIGGHFWNSKGYLQSHVFISTLDGSIIDNNDIGPAAAEDKVSFGENDHGRDVVLLLVENQLVCLVFCAIKCYVLLGSARFTMHVNWMFGMYQVNQENQVSQKRQLLFVC